MRRATSSGPLEGRAVFFDRDGVLVEPVWNPSTVEYESTHSLDDVQLCSNVLAPLRELQAQAFQLFIVSNQPSYAKGKTPLQNLRAIAQAVEDRFRAAGITFRQAYYCYHHPQGVVPGYARPCTCRKPQPFFLLLAAEHYGIDLSRSWMVGDRDSDVECGLRAGCRTILIRHPRAREQQGGTPPDYVAVDVAEATAIILAARAGSGERRGEEGGA